MPIVPPRLDDRRFQDLVDELVARIPAHTPEWTDARVGDPGRTLLELFAWLADGVLYRANLIPERQRLVFLRLLGIPLRPATPAAGIVALLPQLERNTVPTPLPLAPGARVKGPGTPTFETLGEVTVLPVIPEVYAKRPLDEAERRRFSTLEAGLKSVYEIAGERRPKLYATTPVFPEGAGEPRGFDLVGQSADGCLWIALLAAAPEQVQRTRDALGGLLADRPPLLNVGVVPGVAAPSDEDPRGDAARIRHVWEVPQPAGPAAAPWERVRYEPLRVVEDSTRGLTTRGVLRLALLSPSQLRAPPNDPRELIRAGGGDLPPRLDDPGRRARLVTWIRLRPIDRLSHLRLSDVCVNAVAIDQRETSRDVWIGTGDGTPGQSFSLRATSIDASTFELEVAEAGAASMPWRVVPDLALAARDARVFELDAEAGVVRFGDGIRGRALTPEARVLVRRMRAGGGASGNLPSGTLKTLDPSTSPPLRVSQGTATTGGQQAETLEEAERRIPSELRHGGRAVTAEDYRRLAVETPGVEVARAEVLPRFLPPQRLDDVPGVVSVISLPAKAAWRPPNPRPDRPFREAVQGWLDARRPLATELYVIGAEYVPLGVAVGVSVREGYGHDAVARDVVDALHRFLWPLAPGGPLGAGWPLGRMVRDRELEVLVAHVPGVETIVSVTLFVGCPVHLHPRPPVGSVVFEADVMTGPEVRPPTAWQRLSAASAPGAQVALALARWQLPELLTARVDTDGNAVTTLASPSDAGGDDRDALVPVVPEVC